MLPDLPGAALSRVEAGDGLGCPLALAAPLRGPRAGRWRPLLGPLPESQDGVSPEAASTAALRIRPQRGGAALVTGAVRAVRVLLLYLVVIELPIVGAGVVIDRLTRGDAAALASSHSHVGNARFQSWPSPLSVPDAIRFIEANDLLDAFAPAVGVQLAIRAEPAGPLIGDFYAHRTERDPDTLMVGLTLSPVMQGRGFARAALEAVATAIENCPDGGIRRIAAVVDVDNSASVRLFRRAGFTESGTLHQTSVRRDGSIGDEVIFTREIHHKTRVDGRY